MQGFQKSEEHEKDGKIGRLYLSGQNLNENGNLEGKAEHGCCFCLWEHLPTKKTWFLFFMSSQGPTSSEIQV